MDNQMKLGAVLIGGYLLGRTKKGGMAVRIATRMMLSGTEQDPKALARDNAMRMLNSDVVDQIRAQAMEAAKAVLDARIQAFAQSLNDRTAALQAGTDAATDTADKTTGKVKDTLDLTHEDEEKDDASEAEDQEVEGEGEAAEGEGEGEGEDGEGGAEGEPDAPEEPEEPEAVEEPEPPKKKAKKTSAKKSAKKTTKKAAKKNA